MANLAFWHTLPASDLSVLVVFLFFFVLQICARRVEAISSFPLSFYPPDSYNCGACASRSVTHTTLRYWYVRFMHCTATNTPSPPTGPRPQKAVCCCRVKPPPPPLLLPPPILLLPPVFVLRKEGALLALPCLSFLVLLSKNYSFSVGASSSSFFISTAWSLAHHKHIPGGK